MRPQLIRKGDKPMNKNNLIVDAVSMTVETVELEDVELMEESFAASSDTNVVVAAN